MLLVKILKYSFHSPNWLLIFGSYQLRLTRERKEFADPPILIPHNNWFHPHSLSPHPTTSCLLIFSSSFFYLPPRNCLQGLAETPNHTQSQLLALCTRHPRCGALPPLPRFNLLYVLPCGINNMSLGSAACFFILLPAVGAPLFVWLFTNKHDFSPSVLSFEFPRYF